jgi:hypothetical protein
MDGQELSALIDAGPVRVYINDGLTHKVPGQKICDSQR